MESLNLSPYLFGNTTKRATPAPSTGATTHSTGWFQWGNVGTGWSPLTTNQMNAQTWMTGAKRIGTYLFAVLLVVAILLLFIHFFIRPVFRWRPDAPGWITLPGREDSVLFWEKGNTGQIENKTLPIQNEYFGYTLQLDLFIQNPFQFSRYPRLLLTRGGVEKSPPAGEMLLGILQQYNLAIALKPDVNDMLVSVLNKNRQMEVAVLPNVPVQQTFRLTVVVMERALEVYLNGHLIQTVTYDAPLMDVKGDIFPASNTEANIARYRNLKIWPRILTTPEIRHSTPPLPSATDMNATPMPSSSSTSCPSSSSTSSSSSSSTPQN